MTNNLKQEIFTGPIESGETSTLPHEPAAGERVFRDYFLVEGIDIDQEDYKSIVLPKYILNQLSPSIGFREKGFVLITFHGNHQRGVYREIMRIVNEGMEVLRIHFVDPETTEILSTWEFHEPSVHAIDFGTAAYLRTEPAELSVEFDYEKFSIDEYSI